MKKKIDSLEIEERTLKKATKKFGVPIYHWDFNFTPLNTSVTKIFMEIKRDPNSHWPAKMRTPPQ